MPPCIQNIITLLFVFNLKENTITFEAVTRGGNPVEVFMGNELTTNQYLPFPK